MGSKRCHGEYHAQYTPHTPLLRALNKNTIRVTWNHKSCPSDATLVCVFERTSEYRQVQNLDSKTNTLELENPDRKYFWSVTDMLILKILYRTRRTSSNSCFISRVENGLATALLLESRLSCSTRSIWIEYRKLIGYRSMERDHAW